MASRRRKARGLDAGVRRLQPYESDSGLQEPYGAPDYVARMVARALATENGILTGRLRAATVQLHEIAQWLQDHAPKTYEEMPQELLPQRKPTTSVQNFEPEHTSITVTITDERGSSADLSKTVYCRLRTPLSSDNPYITEARLHSDGAGPSLGDVKLRIFRATDISGKATPTKAALQSAKFVEIHGDLEHRADLPRLNSGRRHDWSLEVDPAEFQDVGTWYRKTFRCPLIGAYESDFEHHVVTANHEGTARLDVRFRSEYNARALFCVVVSPTRPSVGVLHEVERDDYRSSSYEANLSVDEKLYLFWMREPT